MVVDTKLLLAITTGVTAFIVAALIVVVIIGITCGRNCKRRHSKGKLDEKIKFHMMVRAKLLLPSYIAGQVDNDYSERYNSIKN